MDVQVIEKIRKLMKRTEEAGCTEAEAQQAMAMASRLMAEHNLDMAEIHAKEGGEESWAEDEVVEVGRWSLQYNLAHGIVNRHFFVSGFFSQRRDAGGKIKKAYKLFGTPENVATARFVFDGLIDAFDRLFDDYRRRTGCSASEKRLFVTGVAHGFSARIADERKAMEMERDIVSGTTGTAIALASIREKTEKALKVAHPELKNGRGHQSHARGSASTLAAGMAAGRGLQINRAVGSGGRKAIA